MFERSEPGKPLEILLAFAREDEELAQELEKHLGSLVRQQLITIWHRRHVKPGGNEEEEITAHLNDAQIIVCLLSADFLTCDLYDRLIDPALARHQRGVARLVPIIARPISWEETPFQGLPVLPPRGALPVTRWSSRDEAWLSIVDELRRVIASFQAQKITQVSLIFSAPNDVIAERQIVQSVAQKLSQHRYAGSQVKINVTMRSDEDIQQAIIARPANATRNGKPADCEIVVMLFWSQMGTPLPPEITRGDGISYVSTNEWDYEDAVNRARHNLHRPTVLLYRCGRTLQVSKQEFYEKIDQIRQVERFFSRFSNSESALDGGYRAYKDSEQFASYLAQDLGTAIEKLVTDTASAQFAQLDLEIPVTAAEAEQRESLLQEYLSRIIEQHSYLELNGLGGDARLPTIPLEQIYVALKGVRVSSYEREQSQKLLRTETLDALVEFQEEFSVAQLAQMADSAEYQAILANPFMPSLLERDRPANIATAGDEQEEVITLGEAFRQKRWMVILGDPGSGKTTLARWIALKLALAFYYHHASVIVPAHQVDPGSERNDRGNIDIGPVRLPILLKISEFAEAYQQAHHKHETLSLADFLGRHSQLSELPARELNELIKEFLRAGRVVVILDGMDEITEAGQRNDIVKAIEVFIDRWINACGRDISPQGRPLLWSQLKKEIPAESGGNQIIITSRIIGYQARPITGQITHFKIQPMETLAVEHFCDAWTLAIYQLLYPREDRNLLRQQAAAESTRLKNAIFDPERPRVRELASNPLLITILALVYRNNRGRLPEQRSELYQNAMKILIEGWRITGITTKEIVHVLSPLAAHIHQYSPKGTVKEDEMREIIKQALAQFRGSNAARMPPAFDLEVDAFIQRVRQDVGLLSERSIKIYGFLHLTFQEYLAALSLVRDQQNAHQAITDKLDDPRWHEPVLMALGHISIDDNWGPEAREHLLTSMLDADDPLGKLIPRSALLIVKALPEMARVPEKVVSEIIRRLLSTYANRDGLGQFASLRQRISTSFQDLYRSKQRPLLEQYLEKAILAMQNGESALALAAASLLAENGWYTTSLLAALLKAFPYDDPDWDYPIIRVLRLGQQHLPVAIDTLPFRKALEDNPTLADYILNESLPWLRLVMLLYGGLSDEDHAAALLQSAEIAAALQLKGELRQYQIEQLKRKPYWRGDWSHSDVEMNLAVYLDNEGSERTHAAEAFVPQFTPSAIINDSPLTPLLLEALRQRKDPAILANQLWQEWRGSARALTRAHALMALLVIDPLRAAETLTQSLKDPSLASLAMFVFKQLKLRKYTLASVLTILGKQAKIGQALAPLQASLTLEQWGDLVNIFFRTLTSVSPLPVGYDEVLLAQATALPRLNAEIWAYWLSGLDGGDAAYHYSLILDTLGPQLESASALLSIPRAYNSKYDSLTRWRALSIPPSYSQFADSIGEALTTAHQSRSDVMEELFYVGLINHIVSAKRASNGINAYQGLSEDALAATLLLPFEFQHDVMKFLDADLSQVSLDGRIKQIYTRVMNLKDNNIRSRALWRLAQYPGFFLQQASIEDLAIKAAGHITDPLQRSRAFERLINYVPQRLNERLKNEALKAAKSIKDPNNRARALARLALYERAARRESLLMDALASVRKIANIEQQADTLQLLQPCLVDHPRLIQTSKEIINQVKNNWYRMKGRNLLSILLLDQHSQLHMPQRQTPILIAALIDEIGDLRPQIGSNDLWGQLLDPTTRGQATSSLLKMASFSGTAGLTLTQRVYDVLRILLDRGEIAVAYPLLPYLRSVESALFILLKLWVDHPPDKQLRAYAGLLLAEQGEVNEQTIPCLIELIEHGIDFGRYRASIVLHGSVVTVNKQNRELRTSQLGIQSLLLIAQAQERLSPEKIHLSTSLAWCWHNIIHDDPAILAQLIELSRKQEARLSVKIILEQLSYCTKEVLDELINQFEAGTEEVQTLLLRSWFHLSRSHFVQNISRVQKMRMDDAIEELSEESKANISVIPDRLKTVAQLLCTTGEQVEAGELALQSAVTVLEQKLSATVLTMTTALEEIIKHDLYDLRYDPRYTLEEAQRISDHGTALELLFAWLACYLKKDVNDFPLTFHRVSTLLDLAGATTHSSPAAVYQLCTDYELGPSLVQAVLYHKSFWGRAGAATLLGYLRQTPALFDEAVLCSLLDVAEVQSAITQMLQNLRYLDEQMIARMLRFLEHDSASIVYGTATLLANIARDEKLSFTLRQDIISALNNAIQREYSTRPVFVLEHAEAIIYIRNLGRLDQLLYNTMLTITGLA